MRVAILSQYEQKANSLARFFLRALESLGVDAKSFSYHKSSDTLYFKLAHRLRAENLGFLLSEAYERKRVSEIISYKPDVVIITRCETFSAEHLGMIKDETAAKVVMYYTDSPHVIPKIHSNAYFTLMRNLDAVISYTKYHNPAFYQFGCKRVFNVPFGYDELMHSPGKFNSRYSGDVAYFGAWSYGIEMILDSIKHPSFNIFGPNWDKASSAVCRKAWMPNEGIGSNMSDAIASNRIIVNITRANHGATHSMKTFELPACGAFVLSNRSHEESELLGDSAPVFFDSLDDMQTKIKQSLTASELSDARKKAFDAQKAKHTYTSRMSCILDIVSGI